MKFESFPVVSLAPMADYTDQPFSILCREVSGKDFLIFREMVSAEAIVRGNAKTLKMCEIDERERPVIIQIFGDKPETMARAAKIIDDKFHPDGIDINMGCPVPKIAQKSRAGAALMKHPDLAMEIIQAIKKEKLKCPLSVKTRLGWSDKNEILEFALRLQEAGIDRIEIHGRTKTQGYAGEADWTMIAKVKKILKIPVLANGDIKCADDIQKCLEITGADGVMIGRGALGNPWVLANNNKKITNNELIKTIIRHAELHIAHYGDRGMVTLRKHLPWYFHGDRLVRVIPAKAGIQSRIIVSDIKIIRAELVRVNTMSELKTILKTISPS
ncbi:MAG: tRNA-dihydrouridine synthase family protein [Patescibacteria group bacterium]